MYYLVEKHKKSICSFILAMLLVGCAGRTPNPVQTVRPGDNQASCDMLLSEINEIEDNIRRLLPKEDKTGRNVALGVAGMFVFPAWFFMDFKGAEKVEIEAYRSRYNHLVRIYNSKGCAATMKSEIPAFPTK